jgi:hypothetical protein
MKHIYLLDGGVNQNGRYELLFKKVADDSRSIGLDRSFEENFSFEHLKKIFGPNAVLSSIKKPFSLHFREIYDTYKKTYLDDDDNYFYHQFVHNCYGLTHPPYLNRKLTNDTTIVSFHVSKMSDFLSSKPSNSVNFIQLSNITDWISPDDFVKLIDEAFRVLILGGKILMRRLNGDISFDTYLEDFYAVNGKYYFVSDPVLDEKSHFYSEIVVLTKTK